MVAIVGPRNFFSFSFYNYFFALKHGRNKRVGPNKFHLYSKFANGEKHTLDENWPNPSYKSYSIGPKGGQRCGPQTLKEARIRNEISKVLELFCFCF